MANYTKILPISFEIIQDNYMLFSARDYLDVTSKSKLDHLVKLIQRQNGVRFNDEIDLDETDLEQLSLCLSENGGQEIGSASKRSASFDNDCDRVGPKRNKVNLFKDLTAAGSTVKTEENEENVFLNPNIVFNGIRPLDETQVFGQSTIGGLPQVFDMTFQIPAPVLSVTTTKSVLTERNAINPNVLKKGSSLFFCWSREKFNGKLIFLFLFFSRF